jgi:hypothetical protein
MTAVLGGPVPRRLVGGEKFRQKKNLPFQALAGNAATRVRLRTELSVALNKVINVASSGNCARNPKNFRGGQP